MKSKPTQKLTGNITALIPFAELVEMDVVWLWQHVQDPETNPYAITYFDRVVRHKIEVYKAGMSLWCPEELKSEFKYNLIVHDLSKFSKSEAFAYANHDFKSKALDPEFEAAWHHHKMVNPHHPEYWLNPGRDGVCEPIPMPAIFILEMLADWIGAGKTYGSELRDWLPLNLHKFRFHAQTLADLGQALSNFGIKTVIRENKLYTR